MLALYWLAGVFIKIADRMRGKPVNDEALGFGDVNLSGVLGLFLGYPGIAGGLILAIFLGGGISLLYLLVMLALRRYKLFTAPPCGPHRCRGVAKRCLFR
jgi:prepilin signal peptidase PulO-like enzyme (type II secretory pathway)